MRVAPLQRTNPLVGIRVRGGPFLDFRERVRVEEHVGRVPFRPVRFWSFIAMRSSVALLRVYTAK